MKAPDSKLAVTLYNLREYCKTESDLDRTLDRVCEIGYQAVQVSGVPLETKIIASQLEKHGLFCCATHENLSVIRGPVEPIAEKLNMLGCDFTALGSPGADFFTGEAAKVDELTEIFNRQSRALAAYGIKLGYHNHHREFIKIAGTRKTMLEKFYEDTDRGVCAEIDVHWVTRGGGSPESWIRRVAGRMPVVHFKDFVIYRGETYEPIFCEIGEGNLNWPGILEACRETGVRWYSIEQDREYPGRNIFESIKISFDNLRAMGVK